jgi:MFS family permease
MAVRCGLPPMRGRRWLLGAAVIDSVGSGLVYAFAVIFFITRSDLTLAQVGLALTLAQLLVLPVPALAGPLADRWGARRVTVVANVVSAAGFAGYLAAGSFWQVVAAAFTVQLGVAAYWTAYPPLVAETVPSTELTQWFGLVNAGRNAGVGVGGAVAGLALATGGPRMLDWLVLGNVVSYLVAAALVVSRGPSAATVRPPGPGRGRSPQRTNGRGGYREVISDRAFLLLAAINVVFVLGTLVLSILLAVYVVDVLHGGAWLAGVLLALNTALIGGLQTIVVRGTEHRRTTHVIAVAAVLNAAAFSAFWAIGVAPAWLVVPGLVLTVCIYTVAEMLHSPALSALSVAVPPPSLRGRYQALFQTSWTIGGAIGPALFTTLLSVNVALPWALLAALSLLVVPATRLLEHRLPSLCD